ncbi:MAG: DEAD/DEAH box helicase family protein [Undibacterium umbellatum]|uniref:DEAD/DEAH box helicase family protein n=1 Tax=Undibacterium umbellatum TaxID=2762300 RepID=UPI003BB60F99
MIKEFKDVDNLSPSDFEIFVRDVFLSAGWVDAEITKIGKEYRYGDGGVDIFAYKNKRKFAIEVKQRDIHANVDIKALNQLVAGAKLANVTYMILVTNSYFTSEVKTRALRLGVELFDRDGLQDLYIQKHSEIGREIRPRFYQQIIIDEAIANFQTGKKKLLIEMATGLGKTYTAAHLIKKLLMNSKTRPRVLFLAHQIEILLQSVTSFKNVLGISSYNYSACFAGVSPENTDFVFATFDTLHSKLSELKRESFSFVIVDEAHHAPAKTYADVITHFSPELLIGLTATPFREDNRDVINFFGGDDCHIGRYDLTWGLRNKYLAFPKYEVLLNDIDESKIAQLQLGLEIKDLDKNLFLHKKDEEVVRIIEKTVEDKNINNVKGIVFCRNINHMRHLLNFFELGTATCVHSHMKENERRDNIRNFREGDYKYILVCDLFNEGIDIPETNLLVFMRFTGSRRIWLQQLGRGLRKTKTKNFINVLDFVGSLERVYEIKQLETEIKNKSFDRKAQTNSETEDDESIYDVLHDSSIEVSFSKSAADVLRLIEEYKLKLGFRDILLDKIRKYYEKTGKIPCIEMLEVSLMEVSLNEISTCFDSYVSARPSHLDLAH